jgi:hypothetical protein
MGERYWLRSQRLWSESASWERDLRWGLRIHSLIGLLAPFVSAEKANIHLAQTRLITRISRRRPPNFRLHFQREIHSSLDVERGSGEDNDQIPMRVTFQTSNASIISLLFGSGHRSSSEVKCASCVGSFSSGYRQRKIPSTSLKSLLPVEISEDLASILAFT